MITHDLGIVAEICDEVAVMYSGNIVEKGTLEDVSIELSILIRRDCLILYQYKG